MHTSSLLKFVCVRERSFSCKTILSYTFFCLKKHDSKSKLCSRGTHVPIYKIEFEVCSNFLCHTSCLSSVVTREANYHCYTCDPGGLCFNSVACKLDTYLMYT